MGEHRSGRGRRRTDLRPGQVLHGRRRRPGTGRREQVLGPRREVQVLTGPVGLAQKTEELVNIREFSHKALAEFNAEALKLDRGAALHVPSVFGRSKPAERGS